MLVLNNDCLRAVMVNLNRQDLSAMCTIRNSRVRDVEKMIFHRKFGKTCTISKDVLPTEGKTCCEAFGNVFNKLIVELRPKEIAGTLKFVEKHFVADLEQLEIRHISAGNQDQGTARRLFEYCSDKLYQLFGRAGDQKLQLFLYGLNRKFPNLVHLKCDFREEQSRSYLKYIPFMPNLQVITITGWINILDVIYIQYELSKHGYWWRRHATPLGVLLLESLDKIGA